MADFLPVPEMSAAALSFPDQSLLCGAGPVVFRGLLADWDIVAKGRQAGTDAIGYLRSFARDVPVPVMAGEAAAHGRLGYDEALTGFNFRRQRRPLPEVLDELARLIDVVDADTLYLGSTTVETFFPGLEALTALHGAPTGGIKSIWLGNRTLVPAHQDLPDNLTCVAVGRRRFTLFPPEQVDNLYIGPLDFNPAGQAISLVDVDKPDLERFPRFAEALKHARRVSLDPGDALFIPSMWWHQVEALDAFNVMFNYWWRQVPAYMDTPMNALMLSMLAIRDLPARDRAVWEHVFRHYVFDADPGKFEYIPESVRGVLGPMTRDVAARLRARLLERINR
ncbi:MAG TPA: cupin-like domain-containing protein [Oleiagrimonas sp.]|nr:cupin-like domain-containing protein [Oleiagrimonas sp.]